MRTIVKGEAVKVLGVIATILVIVLGPAGTAQSSGCYSMTDADRKFKCLGGAVQFAEQALW